MNIKSFQES